MAELVGHIVEVAVVPTAVQLMSQEVVVPTRHQLLEGAVVVGQQVVEAVLEPVAVVALLIPLALVDLPGAVVAVAVLDIQVVVVEE